MHKRLIKRGLIIAGVILIILLIISLGFDYHHRFHLIFTQPHFNRQTLINILRQYGSLDIILLFALMTVTDAVPGFPGSLIGVVSGVFLGRRLGFLINVAGMVCGNILSMLVIQHFGLSKSSKKHGKIITMIMNMRHPVLGLTIGYAVPMIPTVFANYTATKLHLKWHQLIMCMIIGAIPSAWLYACGGDAFLRGYNGIGTTALIGVVLLVFLVLIIWHDRRKHERAEMSE